MLFLRQSTASQEILLGPFLDSTDGNTAETGLSIANTDIKLWKEGGTTEASKNSGGATHIASGRYYAVLDATDTDTLGKLEVNVHVTGALAVRREFMVLPAAVYDALVLGTGGVPAQLANVAHGGAAATLRVSTLQVDSTTTLTGAVSMAAGLAITQSTTDGHGLSITGNGTGEGVVITGGSSGGGLHIFANGSAVGVLVSSVSGTGLGVTSTSGHAVSLDTSGASKHGLLITGGISGTSDALKLVASSGVGLRADSLTVTGATTLTGAITATNASNNLRLGTFTVDTSAIAWNASWDTEVQSEVQDAIEVNHLDHLLAVDYDPASKPGVATALLNELIGSDAGVSQFTANALELAPSGGGGGTSDWNADEKTAIRTILGIPASGTTPDTPSAGALKVIDDFLDTEVAAIKTKTDQLTFTTANRVDCQVYGMQADVITASALATTAVDEVVDAVWDELLTGSSHNIANSAGRRLRELAGEVIISGTATAGGAASISLDASASATTGIYDPAAIRLTGGTGAGQCRLILEYDGATKTAYVDRDWRVVPDTSTTYEVLAAINIASVNEGIADGGSTTTVVLNEDASSVDSAYVGQTLVLRTGTGAGQSRIIDSYVGSTRTATLQAAWLVAPAAGTGYLLIPTGAARVTRLVDDVITAASLSAGAVAEIQAGLAVTGDPMTLTAAERTAIANAHLDLAAGIETGVTPRQALRAMAAILSGIVSGAGTGTEVFKAIAAASGGTTRVTVTVDENGNRAALSLNL